MRVFTERRILRKVFTSVRDGRLRLMEGKRVRWIRKGFAAVRSAKPVYPTPRARARVDDDDGKMQSVSPDETRAIARRAISFHI